MQLGVIDGLSSGLTVVIGYGTYYTVYVVCLVMVFTNCQERQPFDIISAPGPLFEQLGCTTYLSFIDSSRNCWMQI
jgi:hypothetical protein